MRASLPVGFGSGWDNYRGEPGDTTAHTARHDAARATRARREAFLRAVRRQPAEAARCASTRRRNGSVRVCATMAWLPVSVPFSEDGSPDGRAVNQRHRGPNHLD